ncbi:uncharacterized protein LOC122509624 [Leptopilina heterotoma]|uniref:uncharacterized protein LOC122505343 n=1 Tax=Leptopilina heterotoma TaxID=63436 RepID=UPI001CA83B98|nr:uncharacterized protein LOC122505343 [Leptopilina heterotoma]XP_043479754.1 uncharacterized protein LOC122509624 [Leptopilina heterotoma]
MTNEENDFGNQAGALLGLLRDALAGNRQRIKLSAFNISDPELWFVQAEEEFLAGNITSEREKYMYVTKVLDSRVSNEVRDILFNVPQEKPYTKLKEEIIKRLCSSQEEKTRMLLESQDIGDRKPSQFLRHLRGLAGSTVTDAMLKTLWSGRLPVAMQPILAVQKDASLDKLAEMADHIHDLTRSKPMVAETSRITEDLVQQFTRVLTSLEDKVTKLQLEVSEIRGNNGPHRSRERSKSRARSRSRGNYAAEGVCWYHARHGPNATKCTTPCSYKAGNAKASA